MELLGKKEEFLNLEKVLQPLTLYNRPQTLPSLGENEALICIYNQFIHEKLYETYHPTDIDSWRGSYAELALGYAQAFLPLSVDEVLEMLKKTVGATLYGYKGGDFLMGKTTPIWVANYGENSGFTHEGDIWTQAVTGVSQDDTHVILETKNIEY